ncbi:MAG: pentapeptide repeat-containing protein, partial [Pseudanabaena sp. M114S2SP2A07QC]|nr:pentapeptide repeat-containing protein [Pseudanabaena sp. M114S2SP2A07QC]
LFWGDIFDFSCEISAILLLLPPTFVLVKIYLFFLLRNVCGCPSADLSRANLSGAIMIRANLIEAYLARTNLAKADLTDSILNRAELSSANLGGAILKGVTLPDGKVHK